MPFHSEPRPLSPVTEQLRMGRTQLFKAMEQMFGGDSYHGLELLKKTTIRIKDSDYRVTNLIGKGTFSYVVEVESPQKPGERMALKLSKPFDQKAQYGEDGEGEVSRGYIREVAALKKINDFQDLSPYPKFYDAQFIPCPGKANLRIAAVVMERINGENLQKKLKSKPLSGNPVVMLDLAQQFSWAIDLTHQAGFVHRDIKPGNAIIEPSGKLRIFDLNLVAFREPKPAKTTVYQKPVKDSGTGGSPLYMSENDPDQFSSQRDVYALGIVFQEFIVGGGFNEPWLLRDEVNLVREPILKEFATLAKQMTDKNPVKRPTLPYVMGKLIELENKLTASA